jgi:hypothetical protein
LASKTELKRPIVLSEKSERTGLDTSRIACHYHEDGIYLERRRRRDTVEGGLSKEGMYYLPDSQRFVTLQKTNDGMKVSETRIEDIGIDDIESMLSMFEPKPQRAVIEIKKDKTAKRRIPRPNTPIKTLKERLVDETNPEATPLIKKIIRLPHALVDKIFDEAADM